MEYAAERHVSGEPKEPNNNLEQLSQTRHWRRFLYAYNLHTNRHWTIQELEARCKKLTL